MSESAHESATWAEAAMTLLYCARYVNIEQAVDAARLISGHPDWARIDGRPEIAILPPGAVIDDHYVLLDLAAVPEGREHAVVVVYAGEIKWQK